MGSKYDPYTDRAIVGFKCSKENKERFMEFLAYLEYCSNVGHTAEIKVVIDGDGMGKIRFRPVYEEDQEMFDYFKRNIGQGNAVKELRIE